LFEIRKLPAERWKEHKALRLEALKREPSAFGSSFEEEKRLTEEEWRRRMQNVLFAMSKERPIGMIAYVFNDRSKTRHIAEIFGVYVNTRHRARGVGTALLTETLSLVRKNRRIVKVKLAVNSEQLAALRLYQSAGFVVSGREKKELKVGRKYIDLLAMELLL